MQNNTSTAPSSSSSPSVYDTNVASMTGAYKLRRMLADESVTSMARLLDMIDVAKISYAEDARAIGDAADASYRLRRIMAEDLLLECMPIYCQNIGNKTGMLTDKQPKQIDKIALDMTNGSQYLLRVHVESGKTCHDRLWKRDGDVYAAHGSTRAVGSGEHGKGDNYVTGIRLYYRLGLVTGVNQQSRAIQDDRGKLMPRVQEIELKIFGVAPVVCLMVHTEQFVNKKRVDGADDGDTMQRHYFASLLRRVLYWNGEGKGCIVCGDFNQTAVIKGGDVSSAKIKVLLDASLKIVKRDLDRFRLDEILPSVKTLGNKASNQCRYLLMLLHRLASCGSDPMPKTTVEGKSGNTKHPHAIDHMLWFGPGDFMVMKDVEEPPEWVGITNSEYVVADEDKYINHLPRYATFGGLATE